jgi:hypothetical protein
LAGRLKSDAHLLFVAVCDVLTERPTVGVGVILAGYFASAAVGLTVEHYIDRPMRAVC